MVGKLMASTAVALALGAGFAYAASQVTSSESTQVCVNEGSGLIRVASTCRVGEYPMTIGGGSDVVVTQDGTFTVVWGVTSTPTTLPLTGVTISGECELQLPPPPNPPRIGLARILLSVPTGTMDAFAGGPYGGIGTVGGTSVRTPPIAVGSSAFNYGEGSAVVSANGATASITYGARTANSAETCTYLWQATEKPN